MSKESYIRIVIIERSQIIKEGLRQIIESSNNLVVKAMFDDLGIIHIIIVNPSLIGDDKHTSLSSVFGQNRVVALLYSYLDSDILKNYHFSIEIYNRPSKIIRMLQGVLESDIQESSSADSNELSDREKEILVEVAKGLTNKMIASKLNISVHTVISHRKNISRKTDIKSVSGFVIYALLNNLIDESEIM